MGTDHETYLELTLGTLDCYYHGVDRRSWSPRSSVAFALDESTTGWVKIPVMCVNAVITLSIVSLRKGFLPDYLDAMLGRLRDISDLLDDDDRLCYRSDLETLDALRRHVPYELWDSGPDSFLEDVDLLLPPSVVKQPLTDPVSPSIARGHLGNGLPLPPWLKS